MVSGQDVRDPMPFHAMYGGSEKCLLPFLTLGHTQPDISHLSLCIALLTLLVAREWNYLLFQHLFYKTNIAGHLV